MATVVERQHRSAVGRFFRNPRTGDVVVVQMPNIPQWLFLLATAVRMVLDPHGAVGAVVSIVAGLSLAVWAVLEIVKGESPFRRMLGAVVLVGGILSYFLR
jgi:hypothetical protein